MKFASLPSWQREAIEEKERAPRGGNSLQRKTSLQARTRLGVGKGTKAVRNTLQRGVGADYGQPKRLHPATFRDRVRLKKVGRRGRKLQTQRDPWRKRIFAIHGERCIYLGCNSMGPFDIAHAYGKGAYPEYHVMDWNGFPSCRRHHTGKDDDCFEFTPHLKAALTACADEMRASMEGRRPQPTWEELQDIIVRAINEAQRRRG